MATTSVGDFWRRRKIFIILGLILLCAAALFVHMRGRGLRSHNVTQKQQQDNSVLRGKGPRKGKLDAATLIKHLPPVLSQQRLKGKMKHKFSNRNKAGDVPMWKPEDDDRYDAADGKGDLFGGGRRKGGGWGDLDGPVRDGDNMAGEAPREQDVGVAYPDVVRPDQKAVPPDNPGDGGGLLPALEERPDKGERPEQRGIQPEQPGNQLGNLPEQHGNQLPEQPRNQLGNLPEQPGIQPEQPRNQLENPRNQLGNLPEQPGNQPGNPPKQTWNMDKEPGNLREQPGNVRKQPAARHRNRPQKQPIQPGNLPVEPGDLPVQSGNLPVQPGNLPVQAGNLPVQPGDLPMQADRSPGQHNNIPGPGIAPGPDIGHGSASDLYTHSTMPLGRVLSSTKTERQEAVVQAFKHAWKAYRKYAWGADDVAPISHSSVSTYFGMGMTLVDSLDTIWLMGLDQEFQEARDWVEHDLHFDHNSKTVSLFETNIRVLGGLLSAYHLSGDRMFLDKAVKLGSRLLPAFNTPSGIPSNTVSMSRGGHPGRSISTAEAGTLQLEFRDLSRASSNPTFQEKCDRTLDKMLSQARGIVLQGLNCNSGRYSGSVYSAGAGTDSYYEYLIKQWIQSGMTENKFRDAYETSVHEVLRYLVGYSQPSHMAYLGKRFNLVTNQPPSPVMDHLSCFYPGMLALGAMYGVLPDTRAMAANLTHTCYHMYESTSPTGIAPEIFQFNLSPQSTSDTIKSSDVQNLQRPETVESLFYMYRLTKDRRYQDWGWRIFQAFEKYTKIEGAGYACLKNVHLPGNFRDRTESFFLTETLKYLYLLFGDDDSVLSLREWVFNTEAHPLPIWKMSGR